MDRIDVRKLLIAAICLIPLLGCVEEFEPETITFESALVVEATITNEMKTQEVRLSRTFEFEADGPDPERNANIRVQDDQGNNFSFNEITPGYYQSTSEFSAMPGRNYSLQITTDNGRTYSSDPSQLPASSQIDSVYAERIVNSNGQDGVGIFVDSFDPSGNSQNYRYTYEETYKIIAPKWTPFDLEGDPEGTCQMFVVPRERDEQVCFASDVYTGIIQIATNNFDEDRVSRFMVRFLSRENYIISHRYSINVRQLIQSNLSFTFYETLNEFSGSESLFSSTQPGFLNGNIRSDNNEEEKVLGYFEVATVDEKRLFFNYADLFPGEPLPPYVNSCMESAPIIANLSGCVLRPIVESNMVRYVSENSNGPANEGPFRVVPRVCGDCTVLGVTEVPEFWVED